MSSPYQAEGPPSGAPGGKTSLGLESNVGAMLCYIANFLCCLGLVLAIVFLVTEKENRFVKFHAWQSIFLVGLEIVLGIILEILTVILRLALRIADLGFGGIPALRICHSADNRRNQGVRRTVV